MIGPGILFAMMLIASTITIYYLLRSRHIENMAKIEHGIAETGEGGNLRPLLNLGIFLCALGGGFLLDYLISQYTKVPEYVALPTCLLFSGVFGLILSYFINAKITK